MLRLLLAVALIATAGAIGFWFGRQSPVATVETTRARSEVTQASVNSSPRSTLADPPPVPGENAGAIPPPGAQLQQNTLPPAPGDDLVSAAPLLARTLAVPVANLKLADIHDTFYQSRGGGERIHEAADIMAPRGTPVFAMDDGTIQKLFTSKPGGLTIYQFDPANEYCFYYAHLDRYAEGLREGQAVRRGTLIGYVGTTGNADVNAPHLHLAILKLGPAKSWWEGNTAVNPYPVLTKLVQGSGQH